MGQTLQARDEKDDAETARLNARRRGKYCHLELHQRTMASSSSMNVTCDSVERGSHPPADRFRSPGISTRPGRDRDRRTRRTRCAGGDAHRIRQVSGLPVARGDAAGRDSCRISADLADEGSGRQAQSSRRTVARSAFDVVGRPPPGSPQCRAGRKTTAVVCRSGAVRVGSVPAVAGRARRLALCRGRSALRFRVGA